MFAENLTENDRISIVTYASGVRVIADGVNGTDKEKLIEAVDELSASGSTNGSGGIQKAYRIAEKNFIDGGNNRIMLVTDGDFNVGISDQASLNEFISEKRETGVYLSVLGFGMGNTKHNTMETLAQNGNGNSYYVDSLLECQKLFVEEIGAVLHTVAKDTKIQVEFNPNVVNKYRLLGYENKMMSEEEYENEETDAGEIGSGHTTIAMYEINLKEDINEYILRTELRYKEPETEESKEIITSINNVSSHSDDTLFASAIVEFALILRNSKYKANASYEHLFTYIYDINLNDDFYKTDFIKLVEQAYENERLNEYRYD
jgi:Ca-activated chloride channel family protein